MDGDGRRALIFGVTGQDGCLLANHLLGRGFEVHGVTRGVAAPANLGRLGIAERVRMHFVVQTDYQAVATLLDEIRPHHIYNLAGQSSVGLSFSQPREAFESHVLGVMTLLEAMRRSNATSRLFNASSGEVFGETGTTPAHEETPFRPCTPYGAAKASSALLVKSYRESFGLFACSGHLFNHESPYRSDAFVSHRIVRGALAIARGEASELTLGDMGVTRDWGWAPDFVASFPAILAQPSPKDYVIATGKASTLQAFVARVFETQGLDWRRYVRSDPALIRPTDICVNVGNPALAEKELGWRASVLMPEVADNLVSALLASGTGGALPPR